VLSYTSYPQPWTPDARSYIIYHNPIARALLAETNVESGDVSKQKWNLSSLEATMETNAKHYTLNPEQMRGDGEPGALPPLYHVPNHR